MIWKYSLEDTDYLIMYEYAMIFKCTNIDLYALKCKFSHFQERQSSLLIGYQTLSLPSVFGIVL